MTFNSSHQIPIVNNPLLHHMIFWDPFLPFVMATLSIGSFTMFTTCFFYVQRSDHFQDHFLLTGITCGVIGGLSGGVELLTTMLSIMPWTIISSLVISDIAHRHIRIQRQFDAGRNTAAAVGWGGMEECMKSMSAQDEYVPKADQSKARTYWASTLFPTFHR
ncbi:hypothetical protein K469DRAFT_706594 [Zopfia rhizophila CBS 207.26]|uniref:Uncharacterized protein n=1 Tax=Zopfia rhizophila CBS 207.26 TaxID=1314779 RepID=A0A6A6E7P3_9PEZI|nr:hypothetical protein K469DRAFT_706594 [Zopfia rhizophila CBS 207.26]